MNRLSILCMAVYLQIGCAHVPISEPTGSGGAIVSVDSTGITFNEQGKALWVSENVPASWFVATSQGWHLTTLQWHQGNEIRLKRANP